MRITISFPLFVPLISSLIAISAYIISRALAAGIIFTSFIMFLSLVAGFAPRLALGFASGPTFAGRSLTVVTILLVMILTVKHEQQNISAFCAIIKEIKRIGCPMDLQI